MREILQHIVSPETKEQRLRNYAQEHLLYLYHSNKGIKKAIDKGFFWVNGKQASTATIVKGGDKITCLEAEKDNHYIYPLKLEVVYEDPYCAIINKIAGLEVHNHYKRNLINALGYNLSESKEKDSLSRPLPVHRLDKDTSGLLLLAKSKAFLVKAGQLFEKKQIQKEYTAILAGEVKARGRIVDKIENKEAESLFEKIGSKPHTRLGRISLVRLYPKTGRTHQLRIHCARLGAPILGDNLHSGDHANIKGKGLFLCATGLSFTHPLLGEKMTFHLELPKKFSHYF